MFLYIYRLQRSIFNVLCTAANSPLFIEELSYLKAELVEAGSTNEALLDQILKHWKVDVCASENNAAVGQNI